MSTTPEINPDRLPRLIGLHGFAGVGKDTVADILTGYGYTKTAFADAIRDALYVLNPIVLTDPSGGTYRLREIIDEDGWDSAKHTTREIRRLLQVFGTDVGREMVSRDVWVKAAFKRLESGKRYVFTDVRFANEYRAIDYRLGLLIKIRRPGIGPANDHVSESELADGLFRAVIDNDGTIDDLHTKVREILAKA